MLWFYRESLFCVDASDWLLSALSERIMCDPAVCVLGTCVGLYCMAKNETRGS